MKKRPQKPATLGDIAREAGVSRVAASYALRNQPGVSEDTRKRVREIAEKLDYKPDARIAIRMRAVREAKAREPVPIAWINTGNARDVWRSHSYLSPYLEGAAKRCVDLGYKLDEFWLREPGMDSERLSKILLNRGIRGVILTPSNKLGHIHLRLRWDWFACVSFEKGIVKPELIQVAQDRYHNLLLCLKKAHRFGFRRIAVLIEQQSDRRASYGCQAAAQGFFLRNPKLKYLPLLLSGPSGIPQDFPAWLRRYRPDVIIAQNNRLVTAIEAAGYKVPDQISVIHTAVAEDCADWAGVVARKKEIGITMAEAVVSLLQNHQYGLPAIPHDILVRGTWQDGLTMRSPK